MSSSSLMIVDHNYQYIDIMIADVLIPFNVLRVIIDSLFMENKFIWVILLLKILCGH